MNYSTVYEYIDDSNLNYPNFDLYKSITKIFRTQLCFYC